MTKKKPEQIQRGEYTIEPTRIRMARDRRRRRDAFQLIDTDGKVWPYFKPDTLPEALALADKLTADKQLLGRNSGALGRDDDNLAGLMDITADYLAKYGIPMFDDDELAADCHDLWRARHGVDYTPKPHTPRLPKAPAAARPATPAGSLF